MTVFTARRPSRSRFTALIAALTLSATVAGCANSAPTDIKHWPSVADNHSVDLPPESHLISSEDIPSTDSDERPPLGSIRPDDRAPKERVGEIYKRGRLIVGIAQSLNRLGYRDQIGRAHV